MVPHGFEHKFIRNRIHQRNLFRFHFKWSHLSLSIYLHAVVLTSVGLFALCWTGCRAVSLDEAKDISLQFSGTSFEPPPRSIKDIVSEHCENFDSFGCLQKPTFSLEEIYEQHKGAPPYPHRYSKTRVFDRMAARELNKGRYSRSIQLLEMSLIELPPNVRGGRGNRYILRLCG
jgi:hypothetical protein